MHEDSLSVEKELPLLPERLNVRTAHRISRFLITHPFRGAGRLRKALTRLLLPPAKGPTIVRTNYGFRLIVDPIVDKALESSVYYYGTYEAGTLNIIARYLREGDTFIDVGANIGLISLFAADIVGQEGTVYSLEPDPKTFAILQRNIALNEISNIGASDIALGSHKMKAVIYPNLHIGRGSASLVRANHESSEGIEVEVQTLDGFVAANSVAETRMLKIDVEGWELEVLKGASRLLSSAGAPILCVEYSKPHETEDGQLLELYEFILSINDYTVYKLRRGKENISRLLPVADADGLPYHDNLFCFLPGHLNDM